MILEPELRHDDEPASTAGRPLMSRPRAIVVHGAEYADDDRAALGRSQGCFAVDPDDAPDVVDALSGGLLLARAEDPQWHSPWLACD